MKKTGTGPDSRRRITGNIRRMRQMAKQEIRRKANIGSSSLILIFIVLCLVTFSVLSLGNAKREDALSHRSADSVQEYYRADAAEPVSSS